MDRIYCKRGLQQPVTETTIRSHVRVSQIVGNNPVCENIVGSHPQSTRLKGYVDTAQPIALLSHDVTNEDLSKTLQEIIHK